MLIEREDKLFKEYNLVRLPTEDKTSISSYKKDSSLMFNTVKQLTSEELSDISFSYQHLYITSDDELKEDEECYVYDPLLNKVFKINTLVGLPNKVYKVIATTDESLVIYKTCFQCDGTGETTFSGTYTTQRVCDVCHGTKVQIDPKKIIHPILQPFIKKFCKLGGINKVWVEHEHDSTVPYPKTKIKINSKTNTISLKPIKSSWSREEVEEFVELSNNLILSVDGDSDEEYKKDHDKYVEWVKENL